MAPLHGLAVSLILAAAVALAAHGVAAKTLVVAGEFNSAGFALTRNIARWNDSVWSAFTVGSPLDAGELYSLKVWNGDLYAGGFFAFAGAYICNSIARFDGSAWQTMRGGLFDGYSDFVGKAYALGEYRNQLVVAGFFTEAGGVDAQHVATWDGSKFSALGRGTNGAVYALAVYNDRLVVGGKFVLASGVVVYDIAAWDGSSWSPLGAGIDNSSIVLSLTVFNNHLIAGGEFTLASGVPANYIAQWDGVSWSPLGPGFGLTIGPLRPRVRALAVYNGQLYAGGQFSESGETLVNDIARWDGVDWKPVGDGPFNGVNGEVRAMYVYDNLLFVSGDFGRANGVDTNFVAAWDGTNFIALDFAPEFDYAFFIGAFETY